MKRLMSHGITHAVMVSLIWTPMLGSLVLTPAVAQTAQNTTYTYLYDDIGNLSQVTDALGNVSNVSYDPLLRVKQRIMPAPASGAARPTTNFTYDGQDQPATVVDPRNLTTTYTVDGLGNQSALASPDSGSTARTFDAAGNLLSSRDGRGKLTTYAYDALNRVINVTFPSGAPTLFEYDGGVAGAPYAIGRLTRVVDESGQTSYAYDQAGRMINKVQTTVSAAGTVSRQLAYVYAANGQLLSVTYPSGQQLRYAYDAVGQVSQIALSSGGTVLLDQIQYAPFGAVQSWAWGNSSDVAPNTYARTFDLDGRLVTYPLGNPALSAQGVVRTVSYDAANRITGYTHSGGANAAGYNQTFGYDGLGRLTSFINATSSQGYAYDANGNRTRLTIGGSSYTNTINASSNRLSATTGPVPAKTTTIDNAGNLTADGTTTFIYSDRGRLQSATKAGMTTSYLYNGWGQRVSKTGPGVATGGNEFVYDEAGHLIGEYDAAGNTIAETVWLGDTPVALLKSAQTDGMSSQVYYVYADQVNAPRVITDAVSGAVVWSWVDTDPFGMSQPNEAPSGGVGFVANLRFPGQYFDRETGLHYNYFRDYDPQTGRYVQSDPIGLEGGDNTYGYVQGNPLAFADPSGLCVGPLIPACVIVAENTPAILATTSIVAGIVTGADVPGPMGVTSAGARTIAKQMGQIVRYPNWGVARRALGNRPNEAIHHIVEQCQAYSHRSSFTAEQLNSTNNLIRIDTATHDKISSYYSSKLQGTNITVRDWLNGRSFEEQFKFGIDVIDRAMQGKLP
ncbi:type IV secretion protein Rhs [Pseudoduganella sp. FT26W]|uniref:Type IV secretion protein Rhs n=1 Tax=Duganella aquatilis TaxID=2666082 RepID=A0A844CYS0_9BURK|nr:RHS repeat-associated core domain-containing protein [Duganella aquatilis]MRW82625.1 type IV secretion protein Rhs [Duganella aquatilis]